MSTSITLSDAEVYRCAQVGAKRRILSFRRGQTNKVANKDFGWHSDIEAACAEAAAARALGLAWDGGVDTFKLPDVGAYQVRHSQRPDARLIVRAADPPDEIYILVTGTAPHFVVRGWIWGHEARQTRYVDDPGGHYPAWWVPQRDLHPIEALQALAGCTAG